MRKSDKSLIDAQMIDVAVKERAKKPRMSERAKRSSDDNLKKAVVGNAKTLLAEGKRLMTLRRDEGKRATVVVCFGTTAIAGDSLGPLVGSRLISRYNIPAFVYGTEEHCVNGKNMGEWLKFIRSVHEDAVFVAVDASLGQKERVGQLILRDDGVCPAAIKGKSDRFGDIGVLAVVAENKGDPLMQLMSVSPVYVEKLADEVAALVTEAI